MSSDPPDTNAYSFAYKTAVYDNLFVGIVYGRQSLLFSFFTASGSWIVCFPPTGIYVIIYVVSVHILL
jgi:hypothetical protein